MHPRIKGRTQRLAFVLDCEIDQGCGAAECGRAGAGLEVIGTGGPAKRHVEMRVDIDSTRHDVLALSIDDARRIVLGQASANGVDLAVDNSYICCISVRRGHDSSILDECIESHWISGF